VNATGDDSIDADIGLIDESTVGARHAEALLLAAARGETEAFAKLYDLFSPAVWRVVKRVVRDSRLAEDVTQEVFVQLWRNASKFDPARGSGRAFTLTLAHRRAVDAVRKEQSHRDATERLRAEPDRPPAPDAARAALSRIDRTTVRDALSALTAPQRRCIELAYFGGLSQSQIANTLDIPLGTVKTRVREGLLRLRDALGVPA
jgi:RNA polymerase sigma-70 factor, ECF subfamily